MDCDSLPSLAASPAWHSEAVEASGFWKRGAAASRSRSAPECRLWGQWQQSGGERLWWCCCDRASAQCEPGHWDATAAHWSVTNLEHYDLEMSFYWSCTYKHTLISKQVTGSSVPKAHSCIEIHEEQRYPQWAHEHELYHGAKEEGSNDYLV